MNKLSSRALTLAIATGAALAGSTAFAAAGDWIVRGGVTAVSPNEDSDAIFASELAPEPVAGSEVSVDSNVRPSFTIAYMLTDAIAVELIGAFPFEHEISGAGTAGVYGELAEVKHLPPTVSLQYHFNMGAFKPYVGAGLNYTVFFDEKITNADLKSLGYDDIELDDSFGYALQVGADYDIGNGWLLNADVRYIDIETEAELKGDGVTGYVDDVKIDPVVYTLAIGKRF